MRLRAVTVAYALGGGLAATLFAGVLVAQPSISGVAGAATTKRSVTVTTVTRTTRTTPPTTNTTVHHSTTTTPVTPPPTYYVPPTQFIPQSTTTLAPTTTTSTTIRPIRLPVTPSTLPLVTKSTSAHVSPVFAELSGAGFFAAILIMAGRYVMTRKGRGEG